MQQDVSSLLRAADEAVRAGRTDMAQQRWGEALAAAPDHPVALNGLGMLALQQDKAADAAGYFLRAAEREPRTTVLWLNHAKAARSAGDDAGEKTSLMRAIEIEPLSLAANIRLAEHAERAGALRDANDRWRAAIAIAGNMPGLPADAQAAIDHGHAFVAEQTAELSRRVNIALAPRRAQADARQTWRVDAAIDHMLGRRAIYLNQCSGLHVPFLPADEYFDRALLPWLPQLEAATAVICKELIAALDAGREGFEPYVSLPPGTPENIWSGLDNSLDWSTLHLWRHGKRDDAVCGRFPQTAALLETLPLAHLPDRMPTIFFSVLAPHAHIPPHTGVTNARAIIHLGLIVPPGCRFRVGGEMREWVEGQAFAFDDTIEHEAWNDSDQPRVVLIIDCWNPHLAEQECDMLKDFYAAGGERAPQD